MFTYWLLLDLLALITTFGVGIAVNMIFRRLWVSAMLFAAFSTYLFVRLGLRLTPPEWMLYTVGAVGVGLSVAAAAALRKRGYALFSE